MRPLHLVAVMPLWQRHALTALVLRQWWYQIHRLRGQVDLSLVCVGSEGARSSALVEGYSDGICYVEAENEPLNRKWNKGVRVAQSLHADAVLIVGSDDLVSDGLWLAVQERLRAGCDYFGLRDLWFFDAATLRLGYWAGYGPETTRHGETVGLCRCHSRRVMDTVGWRVWPDEPARNVVLDLASKRFLAAHGFEATAFRMAELGPDVRAVDIKADTGITDFARIPYATVQHGAAALAFLSGLCDDAGLQQLQTQWRQAA